MKHLVSGTNFEVHALKGLRRDAMKFTDKLDALLRAELNEMQAHAVIRDDDREHMFDKEYDPTITP